MRTSATPKPAPGPKLQLTSNAATSVMLSTMGLDRPRRRAATKADVHAAILQMRALQIDTISVIARSPYMVLYSRLGAYEQSWLDELLAEGKLFEYWSHEACFLPIEDYALYRPRMEDAKRMGWKYRHEWVRENRHELDGVLEYLRANGATRAIDFDRREDAAPGGWWEWKPEKRALESLFTAGDVMVARRQSFQRVYDLRERVHPTWSSRTLTAEEANRELALRAVKALGITTARWVADYFRMSKTATPGIVRALAEAGEIVEVEVKGWRDTAYVHRDALPIAEQAAGGALPTSHTTFLSPFDPLVWDRARALEMFGFEYRLECYTPAAKRVHGYYVLPLLRRGRLIGRMDAKAHRGEEWFEVKSLSFEDGVRVTDAVLNDVARALVKLAEWHGTPAVEVGRTAPKSVRRELQKLVG
jgi:uncharacterized protein YcaQ